KNSNISQADIVNWIKQTIGLDIHQSTISHLLKNKNTIGENLLAKRQRTVQHPDLEDTLYE
ncbi:10633_t:CDS:1, partial [Cetraspora pellucida]